jgi:hypothetical protein
MLIYMKRACNSKSLFLSILADSAMRLKNLIRDSTLDATESPEKLVNSSK